jgi:hypothetical protein
VALAGLIVATNNASPIAVAPESFPTSTLWLGALLIIVLVGGTYLWTERKARALAG